MHYIHPLTHTFIHRYGGGKAPGVQSLILKDSSTATQRDPGIKLETLRELSVFKGSSSTPVTQTAKSHWHRPSMAAGYNKPPASIGLDLGHAPARVYWLPATGYGHGHSYHKVAIAVLSCPPALLSIQVRLSNYQLTNNYNIWIWPMGLSDSSWVTELNYSTTKG